MLEDRVNTVWDTSGDMKQSAVFSKDRAYRYMLTREWDSTLPAVMFIGLNPSTADEKLNDPTIRRCIGFAKSWGFGSLIMTNLFAFRATEPKDMMAASDPIGPDNDTLLKLAATQARVIIACWGVHGRHGFRDAAVKDLFTEVCYLRLTKDGHPAHPLYLPKTLNPTPWKTPYA